MNRIYTGKGDSGTTSLSDGSRISKAHPRVAAYGKADELTAWIGLIRSQAEFPGVQKLAGVAGSLRKIQRTATTIVCEESSHRKRADRQPPKCGRTSATASVSTQPES